MNVKEIASTVDIKRTQISLLHQFIGPNELSLPVVIQLP